MASLFARRGSGGCDLVNFPEEIKFKILKYLSFSDLKSVIGVCRAWRIMGENPYLWRDFELIVWTEVDVDRYDFDVEGGCLLGTAMLALRLPRLRLIRSVQLLHHTYILHHSILDMEDFLLLIIGHECVERLTLSHISHVKESNMLQHVTPTVIRRLVKKLRFLSLQCRVSRLQIKQIFTIVATGTSGLQELCLQHYMPACFSHERKTEIDPQLISDCLSKLASVHLPICSCLFFDTKLKSLFETIQASKTISLKKLNLGGISFNPYSGPLVADTLLKLESVDFHRAQVSAEHLRFLLQKLRKSDSESHNLKHVRFGRFMDWWKKFNQIPSNLFAESLIKLVSIDLPNNLKAEQIRMLLTKIKSSDTPKLKEINFGFTELMGIPTPLLVDSILKLETVTIGAETLHCFGLPNITVSTEQVAALLSSVVKRQGFRLRNLKIICWEDQTILDQALIKQAGKKLAFVKVITWNRKDVQDEAHKDDDEDDDDESEDSEEEEEIEVEDPLA